MPSYIRTILVCLFLSGLLLVGYGQDAQIQGQVLDLSGAAVSKALVRVVDQKTGTEAKTQTNDNGQYTVPALAAGVYNIFVQAPGFSTAVGDQITLNPGQQALLNFTLKVGATSADVIVTAEKREERLQDVPIPVTVLNADSLADNGQVLLRDYFTEVPGLNVQPNLFAVQLITMRGISTGGYETPSVGILVDGVPFGDATGEAGHSLPDIDPGHLARIEVLRGPQGTLYGANTMSGIINYVTKEPSTAGSSARIETGTSFVHNGAEPGYNLRASVDAPLRDTLAVRVSGFERHDPGYIDNPVLNDKGVNSAESEGGRIALLWKPTANLSMNLSGLYQHTKGNGLSEAEKGYIQGNSGPTFGDLQQNYIAGAGKSQTTAQAYSATIRYTLGRSKLTSLSGYNRTSLRDTFDYTPFYGSSSGVPGAPTATGGLGLEYVDPYRFTQEIRLAGPMSEKLDYQVGAYYTYDNIPAEYAIYASDPMTGQIAVTYLDDLYPSNYKEYAVFANLTYRVTNRFDIQVGGRESRATITNEQQTATGLLEGPTPQITPGNSYTANAFTYLFTPRYRVSDGVMIYARFASGYRPAGGANSSITINDGAPPGTGPDTTENYEVGLKGDFLGHRLSVDGSIYYIDWRNIQLSLTDPKSLLGYGANGGGAKSEGVEISSTVRPMAGLTLSGWFSYDNAVLTQALPANSTVFGAAGDRLPNASPFSGNFSAEQQFPLSFGATGFVGGLVTFVGDRYDLFTAAGMPRQHYPAYTKVDLRAGFKDKTWTFNVYANNIADERGILNTVDLFPNEYVYITPRTVGISLAKSF